MGNTRVENVNVDLSLESGASDSHGEGDYECYRWGSNWRGGILLEISRILNTGLDMETLSICVRLCEQGINPEALSSVIKELRKATEALKDSVTSMTSVT
uniref:Mitotic spindle organizing protein 1 n=1 Tax=Terrapene triunguis TaxID=2587831 RepID=A0A674JNL3_9SAUR